jgi:hypothetical protein
MTRPLHEIADEIIADWPKGAARGTNFFDERNTPLHPAGPYLYAMQSLYSVGDNYGLDTGRSCVLYFLSNAASWKGETARRIKAELREMVK